jgi:hypothetical protein
LRKDNSEWGSTIAQPWRFHSCACTGRVADTVSVDVVYTWLYH